MPTPAEQMIDLLTQTRDAIRALGGEMRIERRRLAGPQTATDAELDSERGDPDVRFEAKGATEPTKGKKLSQLSVSTLHLLARAFEYFADQADAEGKVDNKGRPKSMWEAKNAALARGWARRKSAPLMPTTKGRAPPPGAGDSWEDPDDDEKGFE